MTIPMPDAKPTVLLVTPDMLCASQLTGGVRAAGAELLTAWSPAAALTRLQQSDFPVVILDLEAFPEPTALAGWMTQLPTEQRPVVLAFGPHVQHDRLEQAVAAGCDVVCSRGKMHKDAAVMVQEALARSVGGVANPVAGTQTVV